MRVVLASKSARRQELLKMLGVEGLEIIPASGEESAEGFSEDEAVAAIALGKAREVAAKVGEDDIVIAADTLVYLDGEPLGKPSDEEDAFNMLRKLSGRGHIVRTGVAVCRGGRELAEVETTKVYFRDLSDREIRSYIKTGEPMDKAGAYGAQCLGSLFVTGIEGDFFNVMGLPLCRLCGLLRSFGYDLMSQN